MKNNWFVRILFVLLIIIFKCNTIFCYDLVLNSTFGINNISKSDRLLPMNILIQNRDKNVFNGNLKINVYESLESIYVYNYPITFNDVFKKTYNVSISDKSNIIIVEVYNDNNELVTSERLNIDLSSLDNRLLIGLISNTPNKLNYFDNISLKNGEIYTKTINLNINDLINDREIINQFDCLLISNYDLSLNDMNSSVINAAIEKFINDNKIIIIGTGNNGILSFPNILSNSILGPSIVENANLNFNGRWTNNQNIYNNIELDITKYDLNNDMIFYENDNIQFINNIKINKSIISTSIFDFCDLNNYFNNNNIFIVNYLEDLFGSQRLTQIKLNDINNSNENYDNIKSLVDLADSTDLPDIIFLSFIILFYILLIILIYNILKSFNIVFYNSLFTLASILFLIVLSVLTFNHRKNKIFLTYCDMIELSDGQTDETAIFNIICNQKTDFSFNTSANYNLYPLLKFNNDLNNLNRVSNNVKKTFLTTNNNVLNVDVKNSKEFESNLFVYKNRNDINYKYDLDINLNYFDNYISGRITNKTDYTIKNASIMLFGKIISIGDIYPNVSLSLNKYRIYNVPINNSKMQSYYMCSYPNNKIIEYCLNKSIFDYSTEAKFFGFIEDNKNSIDINSNDINDINGLTLLIKNIDYNNLNNNQYDLVCSSNSINNLYGTYDNENNSITGNSEIINEYSIDNNYYYSKIYFDNIIEDNNNFKDFNAPFYGTISIFNYIKNEYEIVNNNYILGSINDYIDNNKILIKFNPTGKDLYDRLICIPNIHLIGIKK